MAAISLLFVSRQSDPGMLHENEEVYPVKTTLVCPKKAASFLVLFFPIRGLLASVPESFFLLQATFFAGESVLSPPIDVVV